MATSTKQIEANRQNAQKSTGPKTKPGKNRSRYNAKKHGLLTKTFEPIEDAFEHKKDFTKLTDDLYDEYLPQSPLEKILVERLISVTWRIRLIQLIDANAFENQFKSKEEAAMIDPENLNLSCRYETMLNRQFYQLMDRLEKLQSNRKHQEEAETTQQNVKIRNEPIEGENNDNPVPANHLGKPRNSARSLTPRPTSIIKPIVTARSRATMKYPSNPIGLFPTNVTKGGSIRPKLI